MAPPPPKNVLLALGAAFHRTIQARLQAEVDSQGAPGSLDPDTLRTLRCLSTRAHYFGRKNRVCYFAVHLRWSDGLSQELRWRVPADTSLPEGASLCYPHHWDAHLDKAPWTSTLSGARAGSGRRSGEPGASRLRSRPEIGRAFRRGGRKPTQG